MDSRISLLAEIYLTGTCTMEDFFVTLRLLLKKLKMSVFIVFVIEIFLK